MEASASFDSRMSLCPPLTWGSSGGDPRGVGEGVAASLWDRIKHCKAALFDVRWALMGSSNATQILAKAVADTKVEGARTQICAYNKCIVRFRFEQTAEEV